MAQLGYQSGRREHRLSYLPHVIFFSFEAFRRLILLHGRPVVPGIVRLKSECRSVVVKVKQ